MTAVLEMTAVSKSYGDGAGEVHALQDADLTVMSGELVAIMGPSGSGKSTLLTIAGTLEQATSGVVVVDGHDVSSMSPNDRSRLRRRSVGYVFQDFNLLAGLTAAENVALAVGAGRDAGEGGTRRRAGGARRARSRRPRRPLPRSAVGRRAAAGRDRPGGGG